MNLKHIEKQPRLLNQVRNNNIFSTDAGKTLVTSLYVSTFWGCVNTFGTLLKNRNYRFEKRAPYPKAHKASYLLVSCVHQTQIKKSVSTLYFRLKTRRQVSTHFSKAQTHFPPRSSGKNLHKLACVSQGASNFQIDTTAAMQSLYTLVVNVPAPGDVNTTRNEIKIHHTPSTSLPGHGRSGVRASYSSSHRPGELPTPRATWQEARAKAC